MFLFRNTFTSQYNCTNESKKVKGKMPRDDRNNSAAILYGTGRLQRCKPSGGIQKRYVIPSVLSFALSGVYAIVDGFFVGNSIGDLGLSAVNMAYPVVAVIQALGTGSGMGARSSIRSRGRRRMR